MGNILLYFRDSVSPNKIATITATSDNRLLLRPFLSITSPLDGETMNGTIMINTDATANDFNYIYSYIDNKCIGWDNSAPFGFMLDTTTLSSRMHTIKVYGWHKQGGAECAWCCKCECK